MDGGFFFQAVRDLFPASPSWLYFTLTSLIVAVVIVNALVGATAIYTWFERRGLGRFQSRLGPNRWGPFGTLQPIADVVKLMSKEDTVPEDADRPVFNAAPVALLAPAFLAFAVIPLASGSFLGDLNVGVLFIVAITSVNTLAIFMGAWASRNKYAMFGAMRGVAMLISYEVPMALAIAGVALVGGSLSLNLLVANQDLPFFLVQPLAFFVFMTAASAEMSRTPFDMIESESELGGGYNTEYSGMKFAILQLAEFMAPIVVSAIAATLFLSGWRGFGPVPGPIWLILKIVVVLFVLLWVRATWPRLRVDQIMGFAWKALLPLAMVNLVAVAIEVQLLQDANGDLTTSDLWSMAAINWFLTIVSIAAVANILGQKRLKRPAPQPSPLANMHAAEAD